MSLKDMIDAHDANKKPLAKATTTPPSTLRKPCATEGCGNEIVIDASHTDDAELNEWFNRMAESTFQQLTMCDPCMDAKREKEEQARARLQRTLDAEAEQRALDVLVASFPARYRDATLSRLSPELANAATAWLDGKTWLLLLSGVTGGGKTFAAYATLRAWAEKNPARARRKPPAHYYAPDLCREAQNDAVSDSVKADPESSIIHRLCKSPSLVLIDDIGTGNHTPFVVQELGRIIHHREADMLPTIVTTNYTYKELDTVLTGRTARRLTGGIIAKTTEPYKGKK